MPMFSDFNTQGLNFNTNPNAIQANSAKSGSAGYGAIASNVISGITDIGLTLINAQRTKNAYKFNAAISEIQGRMVRLAANVEIKNIRKKAQSLFSTQQALYAKAGVTMEGSPAVVMAGSLKESELEAIYADINAEYMQSQYHVQAELNRMYAKSAQKDAYTSIGKTILNTMTGFLAKG